MTSTAALLLAADRQRPRSQQREIGMSDLGSCRRRTGYKLSNFEPVNEAGSVQAVIGSAVHDMVARILADQVSDELLVEHPVTLAGIKGTLDRYERPVVVDVKTTSSRWLEHIKLHGPEHSHLWQVSCYAAALALEGYEVQRIRIDYLARDTGEEYQWGDRFDIRHVRDALQRLALVRDTPVDMLPRDHEPDSVFCLGCPFGGPDGGICWDGGLPERDVRTVLYLEDPNAEKWMQQLWEARQGKKPHLEKENEAKGALQALQVEPGQRVAAGPWVIAWDVRGSIRFKKTPATVDQVGAA